MNESPQEIGPGEISRFQRVVVAGLRAKQLLRGSKPRLDPDPDKRKNTTIAIEEVRQGLITFTHRAHQSITAKDAGEPIRITASERNAFSGFNTREGP
jgi:DNA-directed RNA polymerase omega subunit